MGPKSLPCPDQLLGLQREFLKGRSGPQRVWVGSTILRRSHLIMRVAAGEEEALIRVAQTWDPCVQQSTAWVSGAPPN